MDKSIDTTNKKFSRWTALGKEKVDKKGRLRWFCRCDCGTTRWVAADSLISGGTRSCGCLRVDSATRHGLRYHKLYKVWIDMKSRCSNPKNKRYKNYGGRGIKVCDRWLNSFATFLSDMGEKSNPSLHIDRINNDGNYEHGNCRFVTIKESNRNTSKCKWWFVHNLKFTSLLDASEYFSVSLTTIHKWCCGKKGESKPKKGCYSKLKYPIEEDK